MTSGTPSRSSQSAAGYLRGLLELARLVRDQRDLSEVLGAVAGLVSDTLGFRTVVIHRYRSESDEYEVASVHGDGRTRELGDVAPAETWAPMLDPRFARRGALFVPAGALNGAAAAPSAALAPGSPDGVESSWHPGDGLFVPLDATGGRHYGIIALDDPASGRRPDDQQLDVLSAIAAHAALAIEAAGQIGALRAALDRHRAVLDSALDAVIAIDSRGRMVDFNPAAERMFGFTRDEAIGRDPAELIIAAAEREPYRLGVERVFQGQDVRRRMEVTGLRSDGSQVPAELTLTLVKGPGDSEARVYGFVRDISERRRGEEQLTYLAYHDPLTGLPNRILIEQQLDLALARARRTRRAVALMFVDLDDFKEANDRFGHAAGDQILASVASRLRGVLRDSDVLARQGGDEFLVLLADLEDDPAPAAEAVGAKLLEALREPILLSGAELRTGASIGVSVYPDDAEDTETLLRHADAAMYLAKAAGGERIAFHRSVGTPRRTSVSSQLRRAMTHSELELHYAPIWALTDPRRLVGLEALLHWRHPDRGLLPHHVFAGSAEHSTVSDDLVDWMLSEACRQAADWERQDLHPRLSLNISAHQLQGPGFASRWEREIVRHGISPSRFMIELAESAWTVDAAATLSVVAGLKALGTTLAMDAFGAGYSSLSRLRELPVDAIKIDPELMTDVPGDRTAVAVLRAVVDLARACEAEIVACGVGREEQVAFLAGNGIAFAQGPLLGGPLSASEITAQLHSAASEGGRRP